ncbi:helix-turn-helix domain-containing protein [Winogradskyella ursingii]|uniref:helix-turn-helix domain-containing protein n=1 Tax=Winogradskyella ursingii TaxID=2686079 RepID=UPI0015CA5093|nr:helix-turn-helix domain-containing protein [Winogradskyella ursingii]
MSKSIYITHRINDLTADKLALHFHGKHSKFCGEHTISFDNSLGKGKITMVTFNHGMALLSFRMKLNTDFYFETCFDGHIPMDFMFLTTGTMDFTENGETNTILSYQNVIIRYEKKRKALFRLGKDEEIMLNIVQICPDQYIEKEGSRVSFFPGEIKNIFRNGNSPNMLYHFGSFNLKIADYIRQLNSNPYLGLIKRIITEGNVNIIMGLQLHEYENYYTDSTLPPSLVRKDLVKIKNATEYLKNNIDSNISVKDLAKEMQLSPQKLQTGFKFLFQKTAHNYTKEIRLQEAYNLLSTKNYSVSEVVYKTGYNSRSYFTQIFFERFEILPSDFLKSNK